MEEITLDVEAITPLFIAGADQKNIENEGSNFTRRLTWQCLH